MADLKPCPACGSDANLRTCPHAYGLGYWVECGHFLCGLHSIETGDVQEARDRWNRRPLEDEAKRLASKEKT